MKSRVTTESVLNQPLWTVDVEMPEYAPVRHNAHADICIVGAGIAGLTTAYLLAREGRSVIVIDDGPLAGGMTSCTSAHLSTAIDDRYFRIERWHGEEGARLAAESHAAAIDRIEAIIGNESIDCDFERLDGYLLLSPEHDERFLDSELEAAHKAGLRSVVRLSRAPIASFETSPCLRFPNQAQFHPLKYLSAVARAIERHGGRLFTGTHVESIEGGSPARIKAGRHVVTSDAVVVATNTPINDLVAIHTKQAPYMTYVIGARVPRGTVPKALYWDTQTPYHYVRLQARQGRAPHDILIVGGEDHKTGQAENTTERHARLEDWARERFPSIEQVEFTWAGQVMETTDGLAFIGPNPLDKDNVYVATGDSGMGLTHGTIAGMLLTDLIMGRENPWAKLYDPSRKTLGAAGRYVSEAVNMAAQYGDWVTGGDVSTKKEIAPDSGAVVRRGLTKVAVYRDMQGRLHEMSAVCNHLGCIVNWNEAEKTWDCPCHGSRFASDGKVINGPANKNLAPVEE